MNVASHKTKILTDRGEYIVSGDVSGTWGDQVQQCDVFYWDWADGWPSEGVPEIKIGNRQWTIR